jgi:hypothetical protein
LKVIEDAVFPNFAFGTALNSMGRVGVGSYGDSGGSYGGFFWDPQAGLQALGELYPGESLTLSSINAAGDVAGTTVPSQKAWVRRGQSSVVDLSPLFVGLPAAMVAQITDSGDVLVTANDQGHATSGGTFKSFIVANDMSVTNMSDTIDPLLLSGTAENHGGLFIGYANDSTHHHPYGILYDRTTKSLKTFPGATLDALNDHGQIVGMGPSGTFVYKDGATTVLPIVPDLDRPVAMNNSGVIVLATGMLYDPMDAGAGWQDLNDLLVDSQGWHLDVGVSINDSGQILATGSKGDIVRPMILTPSPPELGDVSRLRGVIRILFGIVNDAPGLGISGGGHPHHVGSGPDDPEGPRRSLFSMLSAGQRDAMLGLCIGELGSVLSRPSLNRETRSLAARIVGGAAHQLDPEPARQSPGSSSSLVASESLPGREPVRREGIAERTAALRARLTARAGR